MGSDARRAVIAVLAAGIALAAPTAAQASPVLRVAADGTVRAGEDRFLPARASSDLQATGRRAKATPRRAAFRAASPVDPAQRAPYDDALAQARAARDAMAIGTPRTELDEVVKTAEAIDADG